MTEEPASTENLTTDDVSNEVSLEQVRELEQTLATRESEMTALKQSVEELRQKLSATNGELEQAVASYKILVVEMNPGITAELINGDSIKTVNDSLEKARSLVGRVRKSVEKEISLTRIPVGSPGRQSSDLSALSPREKIHYGIGGKQ